MNVFLGKPPTGIEAWMKSHTPTPPTPASGPLCFTAQENGSSVSLIGWDDNVAEPIDIFVSLQYSTDNQATWQEWDGHVIPLNNGEKVYIKALNPNPDGMTKHVGNLYHKFIMEGQIVASGNIQYLIDPTGERTDVPNECYRGVFSGCTSLTSAPELPATTLASGCYYEMFAGCRSLTQAPELPATILAGSCYGMMFVGCRSLTQAPELPATTLADHCYSYMFNACTSLTQSPAIKTYEPNISAFECMFAEVDYEIYAWGQLTSCNWTDLTLSDVENMIVTEFVFGQENPSEDVRINITCKDGSGIAYFDQGKWSWVFEY